MDTIQHMIQLALAEHEREDRTGENTTGAPVHYYWTDLLQKLDAPLEVFAAALELIQSDKKIKRTVGVKVLSGMENKPPGIEKLAFTHIERFLKHETDTDVVSAVCESLYLFDSSRAIPLLAKMKNHPEPEVRRAVAIGLSGHEEHPDSVKLLLELTTDKAAIVREWATFYLGMTDDRSPEVCQALWERVDDEDSDVEGEAFKALTSRKDRRLRPMLLSMLGDLNTVDTWMLDLAGWSKDPELHESLQAIAAARLDDVHPDFATALHKALEYCKPATPESISGSDNCG
ncbi:MAG: HEAT repeat domain-containing protein [Candidatus Hydrogenedentales bacterium]